MSFQRKLGAAWYLDSHDGPGQPVPHFLDNAVSALAQEFEWLEVVRLHFENLVSYCYVGSLVQVSGRCGRWGIIRSDAEFGQGFSFKTFSCLKKMLKTEKSALNATT